MLKAMQTLNSRLEQDKGIRLAIRVGIHTGPGGDWDRWAVAVTRNSLPLGTRRTSHPRLQALAEPDTVADQCWIPTGWVEGFF